MSPYDKHDFKLRIGSPKDKRPGNQKRNVKGTTQLEYKDQTIDVQAQTNSEKG